MSDRAEQARSFGPAAGEYDARRPTYPAAALRWALGPPPARVVDVGAGTGILTRVLLGLGYQVVAVEPDAAMRARLVEVTRGAEVVAGTAEAIPLPDGRADAVVAGQAYHWFDRERAHPEVARVLRGGGIFAPLWNVRDESVPWVARLTEITDGIRSGQRTGEREQLWLDGQFVPPMDDRTLGELFGPLFGPVRRRVFAHATPMTGDGLVALMRTRSYFLTATARRRAEETAALRRLTAELPESFELPYLTAVYRAERR
jgi:SAM-dependent methyltransferase